MGAGRQFTLRRTLLLLVLWLWLGGCDRLSGPATTATRSTGSDPSAPPPLATVVGDGVGLAFLEGIKDFMVTLVLARTNPGAISVARNALRRV